VRAKANTKAKPEATPADAPAPGRLDPAVFFARAIALSSVEAACLDQGITLGEYVAMRLADAAFDDAAARADQVLDLRVVDRVRLAAQTEGGLAAQALYLKSVRLDAMRAPFPSQRTRPGLDDAPTLAPEVAAAIIRAGLEAHEKAMKPGGPPASG
jgi:predicted ATP-grasp superfamily ATP-dependent carboligase